MRQCHSPAYHMSVTAYHFYVCQYKQFRQQLGIQKYIFLDTETLP